MKFWNCWGNTRRKRLKKNGRKRAEERWTKWEDRQMSERQGDERVDMIWRHEDEEEKRRQVEGMSRGDECRMMLGDGGETRT